MCAMVIWALLEIFLIALTLIWFFHTEYLLKIQDLWIVFFRTFLAIVAALRFGKSM